MSRVVVVTGASAGLGRAIARAFGRRGDRVGLLARDRERLVQARAEIEALGGEALVLPLDVADWEAVTAAAATVEASFGPIDVWVNNAMVSVFSPVRQMRAEEYRRVTEVTYLGTVHGTLAALERMLPRDRGVIIQIGSALAYRAIPLQSAYCAAKHAIQGFTESLRSELEHDHSRVRVTMLQLPAVNTPQFDWVKSRLPHRAQPVPPVFQPEVIADTVVWASDHERAEMYLGWPAVKAIVANRIAPRLLDRYLAHTGYASQQTDQPEDPARPDNLWQTVRADVAAHGRFDAIARDRSPQMWLSRHRRALAAAGLGALAFGMTARRGRSRRRHLD
ncbi:MAG TPA: SDR family oxidoreductase [Gemmatimonadales bacterium]|nr:SDR family oxidoreductase [Gemmatimonadales bacterium]